MKSTNINKKSSYCKQLRLSAVEEQVNSLADKASSESISYLEFATMLLEVEINHRSAKDLERKIKVAIHCNLPITNACEIVHPYLSILYIPVTKSCTFLFTNVVGWIKELHHKY